MPVFELAVSMLGTAWKKYITWTGPGNSSCIRRTQLARVLIMCQTVASARQLHCFGTLGLFVVINFFELSLISMVVSRCVCFNSHDDISELAWCGSLKWFGYEICNHLSSWTPHHTQFFLDVTGNEEIPNCNVPHAFAAQGKPCCLGIRYSWKSCSPQLLGK